MERIHNQRGWISLLSISAIAFTLVGAYFVFDGNLGFIERLYDQASINMLVELVLLFICLELCLFFLPGSGKIYGVTFVVMVVLWLHQALLPILTAGLYFFGLVVIGEDILLFYRKEEGWKTSSGMLRISHDFLVGSVLYILFICVISLFGIGEYRVIRICTLGIIVVAILFYLLFSNARITPIHFVNVLEDREREFLYRHRFLFYFWIGFILVILLLQAGRMNIALDYDSLHYGLRTKFILNNGRGIYEKLGFANDVYVYPKGQEILLMPLNYDISYGFVLAFSVILCVAVLAMIYDIVKKECGMMAGMLAMTIAASIPGITNMSVSAKTDIATLFVQLIFVSDILEHLKEEKKKMNGRHLIWAGTALLFSLVLKPTSIFFSGTIFLVTIIYLFCTKTFCLKEKTGIWLFGLPTFLAVVLVWLRTFWLTGFPITSIFGSLWEKMGMQVKYPFVTAKLPSSKGAQEGVSATVQYLHRLFGLFIAPMGDDMRHILIAAPTALFGMMVLILLLTLPKKRRTKEEGYLTILFLALLVASLYALKNLYQVDGNYFVLLYAVVIILFVERLFPVLFDGRSIQILNVGLVPAFIFSVILCSITNWAGSFGMTPVTRTSYGFFDHRKQRIEATKKSNDYSIYQLLSTSPRIRMLSIAEQPDGLLFPCSVMSYTDIEGSGGNPGVVSRLKFFKEYLEWAQIDYIYVTDSFLKDHSRASDIVGYMREDGSLKSVIHEGNKTLYQYIPGTIE